MENVPGLSRPGKYNEVAAKWDFTVFLGYIIVFHTL